MPKLEITSQERSALRAEAHPLRPVVLIGDRGLSESVLKEIDQNLNAHQLIKVRVAGDDRDARVAIYDEICETLSCAPIHHLGKMLIIYRPTEAAVQAQIESEYGTRAIRKPSEPHTPKKLAAEGVTRTRRGEIAKRAALKTERLENAPPRERHTTVAAGRALSERFGTARKSGPRRTGSALSLRAGRRSPRSGPR